MTFSRLRLKLRYLNKTGLVNIHNFSDKLRKGWGITKTVICDKSKKKHLTAKVTTLIAFSTISYALLKSLCCKTLGLRRPPSLYLFKKITGWDPLQT